MGSNPGDPTSGPRDGQAKSLSNLPLNYYRRLPGACGAAGTPPADVRFRDTSGAPLLLQVKEGGGLGPAPARPGPPRLDASAFQQLRYPVSPNPSPILGWPCGLLMPLPHSTHMLLNHLPDCLKRAQSAADRSINAVCQERHAGACDDHANVAGRANRWLPLPWLAVRSSCCPCGRVWHATDACRR